MSFSVSGITYNILTQAEVRLLNDYASWARKAQLARKIDYLATRGKFIGSFTDATAANASSHDGLSAGQFTPGDTYYDTTATKLYINTATTIGAATWTAVA